jgi:hypothetical protein
MPDDEALNRMREISDMLLRGSNNSSPYPQHSPAGYIYIVKTPYGYKIGCTTRPESRPMEVCGSVPIPIEVIAVFKVDDRRDTEQFLHQYYSDKRIRGEWFALSDDDIIKLKGYPTTFENDREEEDIPF